MIDRWKVALAAGLAAGVLGGCSGEQARDQNVAIDINDADPSDIEAVPADETADGTAEETVAENADTNADLANAN